MNLLPSRGQHSSRSCLSQLLTSGNSESCGENRMKVFLAGEAVGRKETIAVLDKYTGNEIESIPSMGPSDVELAVKAAYAAFQDMKNLTAYRRRGILEDVSESMIKRLDELTQSIVSETGMCIRDAEFEVKRASNVLKMYASDSLRIQGEWLPLDADARGSGRHGYSFRVPAGVVAAITAFNNPLVLLAHKLGPACAAGDTVVFKPASVTPLTALKVAAMFIDSGIPPSALNMLTGKGEVLGPLLVAHPLVRVVTFTGGRETGEELAKAAGAKRLLMELGSICPNIVCPDADLEFAAKNLVAAAYSYQGQNCLHAQRIIVHDSVYNSFKELFLELASKLRVGNPMSTSTDIGPMITESAAKRVEQWVSEAKAMGATLLLGGNRSGAFFEPTLMEKVPGGAKVSCEEVFGPVSILIPFSSLSDAIRVSNDTAYGLQAGIFTHRLDNAMAAVRELQFGTIMINESSDFRVDMMPFGGFKGSGLGREGVRNAIEAMSEIRMSVFNLAVLDGGGQPS
jgi:glyceraldehyde-3-phosphate dehydrogenase (NADP+)